MRKLVAAGARAVAVVALAAAAVVVPVPEVAAVCPARPAEAHGQAPPGHPAAPQARVRVLLVVPRDRATHDPQAEARFPGHPPAQDLPLIDLPAGGGACHLPHRQEPGPRSAVDPRNSRHPADPLSSRVAPQPDYRIAQAAEPQPVRAVESETVPVVESVTAQVAESETVRVAESEIVPVVVLVTAQVVELVTAQVVESETVPVVELATVPVVELPTVPERAARAIFSALLAEPQPVEH